MISSPITASFGLLTDDEEIFESYDGEWKDGECDISEEESSSIGYEDEC